MTAVLLAGAAALLLWPARRASDRLVAADDVRSGIGRGVAGRSGTALIALGAAAAGAVVSTPLVAALAGATAVAVVRATATRRAAAVTDAALRGLADGLAALAADLRSGRSLEDAAAAARYACGDAGTGRELAAAVRSPDRPGSPADGELGEALARIAAATRLSARTGCSLAAVATAVEDDLRARVRHRSELRTATAGPRASAAVLAGLPLLGLLMGSGVGADPWRVLTTTAVGQVLLVAGVALEAAGLAWSHRLLQRALR
ncbi:type II secretion system F family protein [Blastococcus sp. SYSU D01042]